MIAENKMNILHLSVNFNLDLFKQLVINLDSYCKEQTVFYPLRRKLKIDGSISYSNIKFYQANIFNLYTKIFYKYKIKLAYKALLKKTDPSIYNVIHAHTLYSDGGVAYKLNKEFNIPYVISVRRSDFEILKYKPWLKLFGNKVLKNACRIICISPSLKDELELLFNKDSRIHEKTVVIPNGLRKEFLTSQTPKTIDNSENRIKLVYIGTFIKRKNVDKLIEFISENNNKYKLTIIGGGGEGKNVLMIENLIKKYRHNNLVYKGKINDIEEIKRNLKENDIFVMISERETFGITYIESVSQGVPIIYSKNTGIDGFFKYGEVGVSIDPNSILELDKAISFIVSNYSEISKNCINKSKVFNWNNIANDLYAIYREAVSNLENRL